MARPMPRLEPVTRTLRSVLALSVIVILPRSASTSLGRYALRSPRASTRSSFVDGAGERDQIVFVAHQQFGANVQRAPNGKHSAEHW